MADRCGPRPSAPTVALSSPEAQDRTAQLWEAATGRPRGGPMPHDGPVVALAFSPDSRIVLTGTLGGGTGTGAPGSGTWRPPDPSVRR